MPQFRSETERKKWDSLQTSAGASLANIIKGQASAADFQKVSSVLSGLNTLAQNVFDEAINAASVQARVFQGYYERAVAERKVGDLTAFELALNEALKGQASELIEQIHDAITLELFQQSDVLEKSMGGRFDHLQEMLPKDAPSVNDLLSANELLAERLEATDDRKWDARQGGLVDRIQDMFKSVLSDIAEQVQRAKARPQYSQKLLTHDTDSGRTVDMDTGALVKAQSLVNGGHQLVPYTGDDPQHTGDINTRASSASSITNQAPPVIQLSQKAEHQITTAADNQTSLYKQLMDFLKNPSANKGRGSMFGGPSIPDAAEENNEQDKADTWWRSFKNTMGDSFKKAKDWSKDNKGWVAGLGDTLAAMILDPTLFQTLADDLEKYLTWDKLKDAAETSWNYIKNNGVAAVDWVLKKLGLGSIEEANKNVTEKGPLASTIAAVKDKNSSTLTKIGNALVSPDEQKWIKKNVVEPITNPKSTDSKTVGPPKSSMNVKSDVSNAYSTAWNLLKSPFQSDAQASSSSTSNPSAIPTSSASGTAANTTVNGNNRSTVVNSNLTVSPPTTGTSSVPAKPVVMTPGSANPAPGTMPQTANGSTANRPAAGTPQISLSTFGFTSGVDDSLAMMNTTFFTN